MAEGDITDARRRNMAAIRGRDTKPEMIVRKALHARGFRYRLYVRGLPGTPDIVLPKHRAAVFVHGCFWHGHACPQFRLPGTRQEFWQNKINGNVARDERVTALLAGSGWRIAVVWECALRGRGRVALPEIVDRLSLWIMSDTDSIIIEGQRDGRADFPASDADGASRSGEILREEACPER